MKCPVHTFSWRNRALIPFETSSSLSWRGLQIQSRNQMKRRNSPNISLVSNLLRENAQGYSDLAWDFAKGWNQSRQCPELWHSFRMCGASMLTREQLWSSNQITRKRSGMSLNIIAMLWGRTEEDIFTLMKRLRSAPGSVEFFSFYFERGRMSLKIDKVSKFICRTNYRLVPG